MVAEAEPGAIAGSGAAGQWSIEAGQMDGAGAEEAILIVLPAGKPGRVWFVAEREGKSPERKKVSLKGGPITQASVLFSEYRPGAALAHVDAGEGGQVLLHWSGGRLSEVWKVGKIGGDETRWFDLDDLDGDGTSEVIVYVRRALDVITDDEVRTESGGTDDATLSSGAIDARAVYRLDGGKWKKDGRLLESLR